MLLVENQLNYGIKDRKGIQCWERHTVMGKEQGADLFL